MKNKLNQYFNIFLIVLPLLLVCMGFLFFGNPFKNEAIQFIIIIAFSIISITEYILYYSNKFNNILKMVIVITILISFVCFLYCILVKYDLIKYFTSVRLIKSYIASTGIFGIFIFILIQIMQVVFLPIPPVIIVLTGTLLFGANLCALFCSIGVVVGSYISFLIGKIFGLKIVTWMFGENKVKKYGSILNKKGTLILTLTFLFPFLPDDLFCMLAGISTMKFSKFMLIATFTRPIGVMLLCYLGGGVLLPNEYKFVIIALIFAIIIILILFYIFVRKKIIKLLYK